METKIGSEFKFDYAGHSWPVKVVGHGHPVDGQWAGMYTPVYVVVAGKAMTTTVCTHTTGDGGSPKPAHPEDVLRTFKRALRREIAKEILEGRPELGRSNPQILADSL